MATTIKIAELLFLVAATTLLISSTTTFFVDAFVQYQHHHHHHQQYRCRHCHHGYCRSSSSIDLLQFGGGSASSVLIGLEESSSLLPSEEQVQQIQAQAQIQAHAHAQTQTTFDLDLLLGDPLVHTMVGGFVGFIVVILLIGTVSQKVDTVIQQVADDYEYVLKSNQEFQTTWKKVEEQLLLPSTGPAAAAASSTGTNTITNSRQRTEQLIQIMEEMEKKEPQLMNKIKIKMDKVK